MVNEKGTEANATTSWWKSFVSRHPELSLRVSESVSHARAMGTNKVTLEKYFNLLYQTLSEENLQEYPCQIFNLDETGMPFDPPPPKVVASKIIQHLLLVARRAKLLFWPVLVLEVTACLL